MNDGFMEGRADRVIRRLLADGDVDQVLEILQALIGNEGNDISIAFRACLIAQGFEADALQANQVTLLFHKHGFLLQIDPREDDEYFENKSPELSAAFDKAVVCVMRAANIDAYVDERGHICARGPILPINDEAVEHLVGRFKDEIDREFPDTPRQGKWW